MTPLAEFRDLTIGYEKAIVSHIFAAIYAGEITVLIGPNGGGKTTLLKTLIGDIKALGGKLMLDGKESREITGAERAKLLSIVMTERPHTDRMTVREIVESGRHPYTGFFGLLKETDQEKVEEALRLTDTLALSDRYFERLSDGQKTRVMIARAICQDARIMVLDEPTGFLDINYKLELIELLKRLAAERKIAVVMSMHELELVKNAADRILCVGNGSPVMSGTYEEIFKEEILRELFRANSPGFSEYCRRMG